MDDIKAEVLQRLTILETETKNTREFLEKHLTKEETFHKETKAARDTILNDVSEIKNSLARQRSFLAGVIATISGLWALLIAAWTFLKEYAK